MSYVWLIGIILFLILEASTVQFVCIWFAGGSLGGLIASVLGASSGIQVLVFAVLSAGLLLLSRPLVKKKLAKATEATNADRLIGKNFSVHEEVNNAISKGSIIVNGVEWSVKSADESIIEKDAIVTVLQISGSKLIVIKKQ